MKANPTPGDRRARGRRLWKDNVARELVTQTGRIIKTERVVGVGDSSGHGHTRAVRYGIGGPQGGMSADPAVSLAWQIRSALKRPPLGVVTILDAMGRPIATVDPVTRRRTALAQ